MNRAIGYGLMGAAQGLLQGLQVQHQQDQEDIRTEKLMRAKMAEQRALEQMKAQYQSQANLEKVQLELAAGMRRDAANNEAKSTLEEKKQGFESTQKALDRASEEKRSEISAGATLGAANIRATADSQPKPRGEQIWQMPDGKNVLVKPDEAPPTEGQLIWTNGGSVGARIRGGTPGPGSALNGAMGAPAVSDDNSAGSAVSAPPAATPAASVVPASAQAYLRANPSLAPQFDAKYGVGSAQKVLGQ